MMNEKVELTRRKHYGTNPIHQYVDFSQDWSTIYRGREAEPYEYTLRFGDSYARVVEDWHMIEMRMSMPAADYNRYVVDRLTNEMLNFIGGGIKKALKAQADANAPAKDNMAYLFKN